MPKPKNTGLGRGLDAIFLENESEVGGGNTLLRLSEIEPRSDQPRKVFDQEALSQLAESIAANGLIQPIVVRDSGEGYYQIIAGERRWRAAKMAGLTEIPAIVMDIDDQKAAELALIENIQRENLNPIEEAAAIRSLVEEYSLTQEEVSHRVGRSRSAIANALRLLDLPEKIRALVSDGSLTAGHARTLLGLRDPAKLSDAADTVIRANLSVRATEALVKKLNRPAAPAVPDDKEAVDYAAELGRRITAEMGRRVKVTSGKGGKPGHLEIEFADNEDLDALVRLLCGDLQL